MAAIHLKFLKKRTVWLLLIFALLYGSIVARLFYIQVLKTERYRQFAEQIRLRQLKIAANRGIVYDRVGRQLAVNVPVCAVCAYPAEARWTSDNQKTFKPRLTVEERQTVAQQVSSILDLDRPTIERALSSRRTFVYLKRQLPPEVGDKLHQADLPAVGVLPESKRVYPSGSLAAHVIGFTDIDGRGLEGIEREADRYLIGTDGFTIGEVDSRGRIIPDTRRGSVPPVEGHDVILTIDAYLQHAAEEALAKSVKNYSALGGTAIVLDPFTGEILALANCPTYNPNNRRGFPPRAWRNRAVADLYEPGSTLKLVTVAAGLEEGISPSGVVATCTSRGLTIGDKRIRCSLHAPYLAGHGGVNMPAIIRHSCNIGAASIALRLRPDKMYYYVKAFGLLDRPGSGLSGEAVLGLAPPQSWPKIKLANVGFGQGIAVSPLQMACAYATVANGGRLIQPQVIREVKDGQGKVVRAFEPRILRTVVSEDTARKMTDMLIGCVDEGTGKPSKIDGYSVAGKTGSAQKPPYDNPRFVASFMGFVPARHPRVVICVVIDEPKGSHWGATVAAPVFKEVAQKAMWYLRVPPDEQPQPETEPGGRPTNVRRLHDRLGAGHTG